MNKILFINYLNLCPVKFEQGKHRLHDFQINYTIATVGKSYVRHNPTFMTFFESIHIKSLSADDYI